MSASREALEAAWRLGGREAVRVLVRPGERLVCPVCAGEGAEGPVDNRYPEGARLRCELCNGLGGLFRTKLTGYFAADQDAFRDELRSYRDELLCARPKSDP